MYKKGIKKDKKLMIWWTDFMDFINKSLMALTYDDFFHVYFVIFKIFSLCSVVVNQQEFLLAWV